MRLFTVLVALAAFIGPSLGARVQPVSSLFMDRSRADNRGTECDEPEFRTNQLKLIKETPFVGLFADLKGHRKFEASAMTTAMDKLWVVFDSSYAIGVLDEHFSFRGPENVLIGEVGEDSQFEGFTYIPRTGRFMAVQEATDHEEHGLVPQTVEFEVKKDLSGYTITRRCPVHFHLSHANKGFEGLHYFEDKDGAQYVMGLCEGNYCTGGSKGREPGHGRVVIAKLEEDGNDCTWEVVKVVRIPRSAFYVDYSGMAFMGDKVAVISQENASVWISSYDFESWEFSEDAEVFHFPRDDECNIIYCNIEGIQFMDDQRIVVASDKAKSDQPYSCTQKDQSIHIFAIPITAESNSAEL